MPMLVGRATVQLNRLLSLRSRHRAHEWMYGDEKGPHVARWSDTRDQMEDVIPKSSDDGYGSCTVDILQPVSVQR